MDYNVESVNHSVANYDTFNLTDRDKRESYEVGKRLEPKKGSDVDGIPTYLLQNVCRIIDDRTPISVL